LGELVRDVASAWKRRRWLVELDDDDAVGVTVAEAEPFAQGLASGGEASFRTTPEPPSELLEAGTNALCRGA
jgi:hypothetical protein